MRSFTIYGKWSIKHTYIYTYMYIHTRVYTRVG